MKTQTHAHQQNICLQADCKNNSRGCVLQDSSDVKFLQVLHYTDWSGDLPGNISDLIHLLLTLKTVTENDTSPVIIQCLWVT